MSSTMRIALVLQAEDLPRLAGEQLDLALIPAGLALSEETVAASLGCTAENLNRYTLQGAIAGASQHVAPLIRELMATLVETPVEVLASQNDLYQYHLRLQFYLLTALEAVLRRYPGATLLLTTRPYPRYWSPMRPEMGRMHDLQRTHAYLAMRLAAACGLAVETPTAKPMGLEHVELALRAGLRRAMINAYRWRQLVRKCRRARKDAISLATARRAQAIKDARPIGIIVRTDSEVVSASYLCRELNRRGVAYLLLQDEMLSSQTARLRLQALDLPYVALGSLRGVAGLLKAWWTRPKRLRQREHSVATHEGKALTVIDSPEVHAEMLRRLLDFAPDQRHFAIELDAAIRLFNLRSLVTYAYVDQWGPVVRETGKHHGLATVAVQNAAQDPEEYPRLAWSDHYCVESPILKKRLMDMGYPRVALSATGLPHYAADLPDAIMPAAVRRGKQAIVVLTQPIYAQYFDTIIRTAAQVAGDYGFRLIVKYHPRQSNSDYADAIAYAQARADVQLVQREPLDEVLQDATLAISVVSAALFRAIFLGIPTFSQLPIEERHLDLDYVRHPVMRTVETDAMLDAALRNFLDHFDTSFAAYTLARDAYLAEHAQFEPGPNPQENVADIVLRYS